MNPNLTTVEDYERLRAQGRDLAGRGSYDEALEQFAACAEVARNLGDRKLLELAELNRAAICVICGEGSKELAGLRMILMGSAFAAHRHIAAYNVSIHYDQVKNREKSLRYARLALDHACVAEVEEFVSRSHNRLANTLTAESYFEEAREHYLASLSSVPEETLEYPFILANLGYCDIVTGRTSEGFRRLYSGLRGARRNGGESMESWIRLDLCYAHLEIGRYEDARRHGVKALINAERYDRPEHVKNSLYLLGEVAKVSGESLAAYSYFARLRDEFYPEKAFIADLLMTVDARSLVNLKA